MESAGGVLFKEYATQPEKLARRIESHGEEITERVTRAQQNVWSAEVAIVRLREFIASNLYKDLITLAEEKKYSDGQLTRVKGKLNIQDDWAERKIKGKKPKKEKFWFLKK